ncbi:MAG: hypothetical protein ABIJ57_02595 [Pseudomonadota bacterium]
MTIKPGWVWYEKKGNFRPFTEFRHIAKGRNRGKVEVLLPAAPARRILVDPGSIRSYPVSFVNPKSEEREPGLFETKEETQP